MLLIVMQSAHLVAQRKAFQQSMGDVLTLSREQTSSQPLIASALEELKVLGSPQAMVSNMLSFYAIPKKRNQACVETSIANPFFST